jgi:D-alanine-D-alanine ligase
VRFFDGGRGRRYPWRMSGSKQRIAVLLDGFGAHRAEPATMSSGPAAAILAALSESGHEARPLLVDRDLDLSLRQGRYEVAFLATRGRYLSDGCLQGLLEVLGIAYTGSGVLASALATNQARSRDVLRLANLPTAPAYLHRADSDRSPLEHHGSFGFPVVVSPAGSGLGSGATLASDELELEAAVEEAFRVGDEVMVGRATRAQANAARAPTASCASGSRQVVTAPCSGSPSRAARRWGSRGRRWSTWWSAIA